MRLIDAVTAAEIISKELCVDVSDLVDVFAKIPTAYTIEETEEDKT